MRASKRRTDRCAQNRLNTFATICATWVLLCLIAITQPAFATPFTRVSPDGTALPSAYPEAGGVALILYGANGNIYYQFSDPAGAFVGFQNNGQPAAFRGNPFTINNPLTLDCGLQSCAEYFGNQIVRMEVRFTAQDGDTQQGGFDQDDISLLINGVNIGNWSDVPTENTNTSGTQAISSQLGFGNRTFDTGWFATNDAGLLAGILANQSITTQVFDADPNDNFWNFMRGNSLANPGLARVAPAYTLDKRARSGSFNGPDITSFNAVGETVFYTYDIQNVGSVRIDNLQVSDDRLGVVNCTPTTINVGQTATCQASHVVTQQEFDDQVITNVAVATGDPEFGQLGTLSDTVTLTGPGRNPGISIVKNPKNGTYAAAGQTINYTFEVRNTGDVTLSNVAVTDPLLPTLNCTQAGLAPDGVLSCSASYSVTQDDVDNGSIVNTATVNAVDPINTAQSALDSATNTALPSPAFSVLKSTPTTPTAAGQTLTYNFAVRNDGNVSIRNVTPADAKCASPISLSSGDSDNDGELDVGETHRFTCTSVPITQPEVDAGVIDNTVTVTGTPAGGSLNQISDDLSTPITRTSDFNVVKSLISAVPTMAGQTLTYQFVVTNTGNASINTINISDAKCASGPTLQSGDTSPFGELAPSETFTYTCPSIPVTQTEVDAGAVNNTVNITGTGAGGTAETGTAMLSTPVNPAPAFSVVKSTADTPTRAGDRLNYTFQLTNDGNVTIRNIALSDPKCASSISLTGGDTNNNGALDVTEVHEFSCQSIPVTQAEVDAGQVDNTVSVSGTPAGGTLGNTQDSNSTPITPAPALSLDKRLNANSPTSFDSTTDVLLFDFVVTNTGNVSLTNAITINDPMLDAAANCPALPAGGLLPGASLTCMGQHTATQPEIDAGSFTNSATASSGATTSASDTVTVPAQQNPALSVSKSGTEPTPFSAGQTITYTYVVTNTGNTTIPGSRNISIDDNRIATVTCDPTPGGGIPPGGTLQCMATYVVDADDLSVGTVTNTATATDGFVTSPTTSETVPANFTPALSLTKTADPLPADFSEAGDEISYTYEIQNTGGADFTEIITISDNRINNGAPFTCWEPTGDDPLFVADQNYPGGTPPSNINGETATCSATYAVTQADIDAGFVENEAVAETVFAPSGSNLPIASAPDRVTVPFTLPARLSVAKTAVPADLTSVAPGDVITYSFELTNTGEVTLDDVIPLDTGPTFGGQPASNTLTPFTVTVGPDGNTDGAVDTLAPDASATVTATYTLTQADIDNAAAGADPSQSIANSATATASPRSGTLDPVTPDGATTGFSPEPAFVVSKETASTPTAAGDTLDYTFFVNNTGNVAISNIVMTDPKCASGPTFEGGDLDNNDILNVGENWRYSCTSIAVTQTEVDAGQVNNTITASGTPAGGALADVTADLSTDVAEDGALEVVKSANTAPTQANQTIVYSFVVSNTGNVSIVPGVLDDPKCAANPVLQSGDANNDDALNPTETWTYTCTSVPVTQAEINDGLVSNTVSVPGTTPSGDPITPPTDTVDTPVAPAPGYAVTKVTADTPSTAGQQLAYTFRVVNNGNVSLSNINVTDAKCSAAPTLQSGDTNNNGALDPDETHVFGCTSVPLTQVELDSGTITNTVNVTANTPDGTALPQVSDTLVTPVDALPAFELAKTTSSTPTQAGDTLVYGFTLNNTGNVSISAISISDQKCSAAPVLDVASDAGADDVLSPGEIWMLSCTSIPVTQVEIDAGQVNNTATATGTPTGGTLSDADASSSTNVPSTPGLAIAKSSASTPSAAGDTLVYDFSVTNTGNTSLSSVTITDAKCATVPALQSGDANNDDALNPTETWAFTCTSVPVTQGEADAGIVLNTADVDAQDPSGTSAPTATDTSQTDITENGGFSVVKDSTSVITRAGQTLEYTFAVSNDGNVSIRNIAITDAKCAAPPQLQSGDSNNDGALNPVETFVFGCTSIPVTQAEVDAGQINNSASVDGTVPGGNALPPATDTDVTGVAPSPSLEAIKTITSTGVALDDTVTFRIEVRNTGNVTLTAITLSDTLTRADGTPLTLAQGVSFVSASDNSPFGMLLPNEVAVYTASYVLTQPDIDAGGLANTATAMGNPPNGAPVEDTSDDGIPGNGNDNPTLLNIPAQPALGLTKTLEAVVKADNNTAASFDTVGDRLDYIFRVSNLGNVTITDPVSITDPLITGAGGVITCDPVPLVPGGTLDCRGSYAVTLDDLNTGQVDNSATASDGNVTSPNADVTVTAVQSPAINTVKTARPISPTQFVVGATVTYDYVTTNTGNVTLTTPVEIIDNLIPASDITCPPWPGTLDPGETYTCIGTYTVTSDDVDLGVVTNIALGRSGTTDSPQVSESIPDNAIPALSIVKSSVDTSFASLGDQLNYSFDITNSGERAFVRPITVEDSRIGSLTCWTPTPGDPDFQAGESATCSAPYTVTQMDLDAGFVTNEAFAQTFFGNDTPVVSAPDSVTIDANRTPALALIKSVVLPQGRTNQTLTAGDVLSYTLTLRNPGNQTVRNITVADPLLGLTCPIASLAPGGVNASCRGTLTLTQTQIDAGQIVNDATANGADPQGGAVGATDQLITPLPTPAPGLSLVKSANVSPFGPVGSTIVYGFEVTNTGNVTLRNVALSDPRVPGFACTIPRLLPQEVNGGCSAPYTVTQDDVDAGSITNTASATGRDPSGAPVSGSGSVTTPGPAAAAGLEATKTFLFDGTIAGSLVTFNVSVVNTGNVTLSDVVPTDTLTRANGDPLALNAPGLRLISGDTDNDNALDVTERWIYTGTYTLQQEDINQGGISNVVVVTARDPNGAPVDDTADDGDDADGNTTDDPTVFDIPFGPLIGMVKSVSTPGAVAGDTVVFDFAVRNLGNVDLEDVTLSDTLTRADGAPLTLTTAPQLISGDVAQPGVLNLREVFLYRATYMLTQADIDAGGIANTATVMAVDGSGFPVMDISDDGDSGDGNTVDDPALLNIPPAAGVVLRKTATNTVEAIDDVATFLIEVENTGNVTLSGIALTDTLTRADGTVLQLTSGPRFTGATAGSTEAALLPDGIASYSATYQITQEDIDAGGISNTVTGSVMTPGGATLTDISDDPNSPAPGPSDPTAVALEQLPSLVIEKSLVAQRVLFPTVMEVTFDISVANDGNTTLTELSVVDDLAAFAAPAVILSTEFPTIVSATGLTTGDVNAGFDGVTDIQTLAPGATLAPGETAIITITTVYEAATGFPTPGENTANATTGELPIDEPAVVIATNIDSDGDGVPDGIESDTIDRDGDGIPDASDYDPTGYFYCEDSGRILSGGQISVSGNGFSQTGTGSSGPIRILRDGSTGEYQFFVTRPGTYQLSYTPPGNAPSETLLATTTPLDVTNVRDVLTGSATSNPRVLGSSEFGTSGALADFSAAGNPAFYTNFVIDAGDPAIFSNNIPFQCQALGDLVASKSVIGSSDVRLGDLVTYQLVYDLAGGAADLRDLTFTDILPVGISYVPGSASIARAGAPAVALEPVRAGRRLSWSGEMMTAGTRTVIMLSGRVGPNAPTGNLVNRTQAQGPTGEILSNVAEAIVRRVPEHVFDCSDVIGKVFDDRNRNGYQDGPDGNPITDQSFESGKFSPAPAEDGGEPGLAGVRIATVNGTLITTDAFGRYHVPCAELPGNIGSNFILKVDERSLPSGYRLTTENPRVVRLTAGKFAKMNFGAALGRVIDITLSGNAFDGGATPSPKLADAVRNLSKTLRKEPSVVRLSYVAGTEAEVKLGRARMRAVEKLLKREWRRNGTYKLTIEKTIQNRR